MCTGTKRITIKFDFIMTAMANTSLACHWGCRGGDWVVARNVYVGWGTRVKCVLSVDDEGEAEGRRGGERWGGGREGGRGSEDSQRTK